MDVEGWADLVDRFTGGPVSAASMFGSPCLRTGRKVFAIWWHREHLVVKPPPDRAQALLAEGAAEPFEPVPGRSMSGWLLVSSSLDAVEVAEQARAHVAALAVRAGGSSRPSG